MCIRDSVLHRHDLLDRVAHVLFRASRRSYHFDTNWVPVERVLPRLVSDPRFWRRVTLRVLDSRRDGLRNREFLASQGAHLRASGRVLRRVQPFPLRTGQAQGSGPPGPRSATFPGSRALAWCPVSYTHLTLPTSD